MGGFPPKIPPSFTESIYWYSCMLFWAQIFVYLHVLSLVSYLEILYSESIGLMNLCIEQLIDPICKVVHSRSTSATDLNFNALLYSLVCYNFRFREFFRLVHPGCSGAAQLCEARTVWTRDVAGAICGAGGGGRLGSAGYDI